MWSEASIPGLPLRLVAARGGPPVRAATFPLPLIAVPPHRRLVEVHELEPSVIHLPPVLGT